MRVILDIEANGLDDPTKVWCIHTRDIDTGEARVYSRPSDNERVRDLFLRDADSYTLIVGHHILAYDIPVLQRLLGLPDLEGKTDVLDTLIVAKMADYERKKFSLEDYGQEFGFIKDGTKTQEFFNQWSQELEDRCSLDTLINLKVYTKYLPYIEDKSNTKGIDIEHKFQYVCNTLSTNGFYFNTKKAKDLLEKVTKELNTFDNNILDTFKPRSKLIREITPKVTKFGTINKQSIPKAIRESMNNDLSAFSGDAPFSYIHFQTFNPASHKQVIDVLTEAGWQPTDKTETRKDDEREYAKLQRTRKRTPELDLKELELYNKLLQSKKYGWKINENNLATLPPSAPAPAKLLAKRILLESRRRTLTEWLELVHPDTNRIHGRFYGIGAWTQRMAHQNPNTANIPNEFDTSNNVKLLGKELRSLWSAPRNRLLVGVDAEGIQLRIFAHYINDPEFTHALVEGKKEDKTDPHSLNQRVLGSVCKSRAAAKRFIYALLLGAGLGKLTEILGCSKEETEQALDNLLRRYEGFAYLKQEVIPKDAAQGFFRGLDGRKVFIPGTEEGLRRHLAMSGYLQNGEAIAMKYATLKWVHKLKDYNALLVNFVHDEWQVECPNNVAIALEIAGLMSQSLVDVGNELGLKCPLAGSYYNDDKHDYTIGTNWYQTH